MTKLERLVLKEVERAGELGITAQQIATKLNVDRQKVSFCLWLLKRMGKVTNSENRIIWKLAFK